MVIVTNRIVLGWRRPTPSAPPSGTQVPDMRQPRPHLTVDPRILGGYPVVAGSRVPFDVVAGRHREALSNSGLTDTRNAVGVVYVEADYWTRLGQRVPSFPEPLDGAKLNRLRNFQESVLNVYVARESKRPPRRRVNVPGHGPGGTSSMDAADPNPAPAALRYRAANTIAGLDLTLRRLDDQMPDATAAEVSSWAFEIAAGGQAFLAACATDPDEWTFAASDRSGGLGMTSAFRPLRQ